METSLEIAKIKLSSKLNKKDPPILASFSCGQLNDNSKIEFQCFKPNDDEDQENKNRILMAQTRYLTYEGSSNDNSAKFSSQYFIGVRSKRTGKMKLFGSSFFHLKPKINKVAEAAVDLTETESPNNSYWESRNKLTAAFGGKVSKRILSSQLKFAIDADSVEASKIENLPTPETTPLPQSEPSLSYLPFMNRETTSLDEIFDANEIIPPEDDLALEGQAEVLYEILKSDPDSAKASLCKFVQQFLVTPVEDPQELRYLIYYNYLVIFQNLTYNDIRKKDPTPLIPEPFKQSLINKFTILSKYESGRSCRVFPPQLRDKLVAHIFVLALLISNYTVNINKIIEDLKRVAPKQLNLIAQTLGCHITTEKSDDHDVKIAQLRFPLAEAPQRFKKRQF